MNTNTLQYSCGTCVQYLLEYTLTRILPEQDLKLTEIHAITFLLHSHHFLDWQ